MSELNMSTQSNMYEWIVEHSNSDDFKREDSTEILFLGDVALAGKVGDVIQQHGSQFLFSLVPPDFFAVDILCYNLECCLSERGAVRKPKPVPFRGSPDFLSVFPKGRCKYIANVANNHFLDYGEDAALDTLEALRIHGVRPIGATGEAADNERVVLKTRAGDIGFIAFSPSAHPLPDMASLNVARRSNSQMAS